MHCRRANIVDIKRNWNSHQSILNSLRTFIPDINTYGNIFARNYIPFYGRVADKLNAGFNLRLRNVRINSHGNTKNNVRILGRSVAERG